MTTFTWQRALRLFCSPRRPTLSPIRHGVQATKELLTGGAIALRYMTYAKLSPVYRRQYQGTSAFVHGGLGRLRVEHSVERESLHQKVSASMASSSAGGTGRKVRIRSDSEGSALIEGSQMPPLLPSRQGYDKRVLIFNVACQEAFPSKGSGWYSHRTTRYFGVRLSKRCCNDSPLVLTLKQRQARRRHPLCRLFLSSQDNLTENQQENKINSSETKTLLLLHQNRK